jgi:predicted ester cyclase
MSNESAKEVVRRLIDGHRRHDVALVREVLSPQLVWHAGGAPEPLGRDAYLAGLEMGAKAFSDHVYTIDDLVAEGEGVAMRMTVAFRHTGQFMDIAATGKSVTFTNMWFYKVVGAQVTEAWNLDQDLLAKLRA